MIPKTFQRKYYRHSTKKSLPLRDYYGDFTEEWDAGELYFETKVVVVRETFQAFERV